MSNGTKGPALGGMNGLVNGGAKRKSQGSPGVKRPSKRFVNAGNLASSSSSSSVPVSPSPSSSSLQSTPASSPTKKTTVDSRIVESRKKLPIWMGREAIVDAVHQNDTVVVLGETGCGKTTQIPQFLYEAGFGESSSQMIGITQPRRVAATSLAKRVAVEMGVRELGAEVGYSIRFDDRTSPKTRIKFMTDGWLLREMLGGKDDGTMSHYSVLILDEAHERSIHTDVLLGLAKRAQRIRKRKPEKYSPLKIVVMSATIDAEVFSNYFAPLTAPILYVKGRQFPITLYHSVEALQDWVEAAKKVLLQMRYLPQGDVLIFMTGAEEIESFARQVNELNPGIKLFAQSNNEPQPPEFVVCPLYAALGPGAVGKVYAPTPPGCRKVVLATNIAETSITIPGIRYVIDCGLAKQRSGGGVSVDMLEVKPISKSAARQRAGRAGREAPGSCYRLYREEVFDALEDTSPPEILRADLTSTMLDVLAMGLDPLAFDWMDRPDDEAMKESLVLLLELGALQHPMSRVNGSKAGAQANGNAPPGGVEASLEGKNGGKDEEEEEEQTPRFELSPLGRRMAALPLTPPLSRTLIAASESGQATLSHALSLVSILSSERRSILVDPPLLAADDEASSKRREDADRARRRMSHKSGDHITQLTALYAFEEQERASKKSSSSSNGTLDSPVVASKGFKNTNKNASAMLKDWCETNFVSLKAIREVQKIREQLRNICRRLDMPIERDHEGLNGGKKTDLDSSDENEDDEDGPMSNDGLYVTKGGANQRTAGFNGVNGHQDESYDLLLRALITGRKTNAAFRQPDGHTYTRAFSKETFKIHPSSTLFSARKTPPSVIFFDELTFTTQIFARGVSAIEPSWLQ